MKNAVYGAKRATFSKKGPFLIKDSLLCKKGSFGKKVNLLVKERGFFGDRSLFSSWSSPRAG